jgi:uncharacterized membrane protein YwzB
VNSKIINIRKQLQSNGLKLVLVLLIIFTGIIIIGDFFLYLNYSLKYKYEVDLVRYKQEDLPQLKAAADEIQGILGLSRIVFVYAVSIFFFLIFIMVRKHPNDTKTL